MTEARRPNVTLTLPEVNAFTVGQLLYMLEMQTAMIGELFKINTYDQPAVQLGKDATYALMGKPGYEKLRKEIAPVATKNEKYLL